MPRTPAAVKPKSKARSKRSPSANPKPNEDSESDSDPGPLAKKPKHTTRPASKKREASVKPEPETESSSSDESIYTPPPPKTLKRVSLPEIGRVTKVLRDELGGLNAEEIKLLIRGMRRKSVPARVGVRSDVPKDEEGGLEDEDYVEEEAVLSGDESEDDGREIQERAEKLASSLALPFNQLQAQSIASLATSLSGMTSTLQMALEPFHGGPILQQLEIWHKQQDGVVKNGIEGWDEMMGVVKGHKTKLDDMTRRIALAVAEKAKIIAQGKKDAEAALKRQAAELQVIRADLAKSKAKLSKKMEKAVDKTRIGKEVNMAIAEILKGLEE